MKLKIHKAAAKNLKRSPLKIRKKAFDCIVHLRDIGSLHCPYPIEALKGQFKKHRYFEAKIDKDYRIIYRIEGDTLFVRYAGTHNQLGTG